MKHNQHQLVMEISRAQQIYMQLGQKDGKLKLPTWQDVQGVEQTPYFVPI